MWQPRKVALAFLLLGEQHEIFDASQPYGVPPDVPLLSEGLKQRGYACHAVGQVRRESTEL